MDIFLFDEVPDAQPTFIEPSLSYRFATVTSRLSSYIQEWTPFVLVVCYFAFSISIYMVCNEHILAIFWFIYLALNFYIAASTVLEAFLSLPPIREARRAVDKAQAKNWTFPTPDNDLPILDLVIVAYLPNEADIIKNRIHYLCNEIVYPKHLIRINCVYNTPRPIEPLETELRDMMRKYEELRIIEVPNSHSKAENLNFFFSIKTGADIIAIYDCDHYPHPYSPRWAIECRAAMTGFGLFAGSNGYWRANLLREHKMDGTMLTEDIDSTLRAFSKGWNVVHDLNVVSYELAPTSIKAFWKQRMRWAQGWTQASIRHLVPAWNKSPAERAKRRFGQRFGIFSLLFVRETSYYLVTQYTCLIFVFLITSFPHSGKELVKLIYFQYAISQWCFFTSVMCLLATLYITNIVRNEFTKRRTMILFAVLYPFYLVVIATMGIYAHARQIVAYSNWNPTARA
ncbi:hypothetical protein EJ08DRAFT_687795 [Tothia fuscella]|uniref:Glycosyltransferase 2-like domain-containing protein n=1 Tax=Tothia fuscella TaxID=1048955 RepID=A0A9P4TZ39_9PEZI|nr:hypothetical protein EJ08DRAFT_687795 [Tothia fuscella]